MREFRYPLTWFRYSMTPSRHSEQSTSANRDQPPNQRLVPTIAVGRPLRGLPLALAAQARAVGRTDLTRHMRYTDGSLWL